MSIRTNGFNWRSLLLLPALLFTLLSFGQVDNVYVYGTVKDYNTSKKLDGVKISIYKNGGKLTEAVTSANGKYEFNLDYGSDYKLVYEKAGMVSKNITLDTKNVPEEDRVGGQGMNVELTLFANIPDVDFSILQQPIGKCKFDPVQKVLIYDQVYTDQIRAELGRLMKEYDDKKKREANAEEDFNKLMAAGDASMGTGDYKKAVESFTGALALKAGDAKATAKLSDAKMKLDAADADKKREESYAALIKDADALFGKKSYEEALSKYNAALDIKDEEHPKNRARECTAFIEEAKKKADEEKKAKELEEKYKAAITAADAAFKGEKYEDARTKYQNALDIKGTEQYPKDQIAAIGKKLEELAKKEADEKAAKELEAKYKAAIIAGDAAFKANNFDQAKEKYNEALGLKKEEKYPKDQLAAIDKKLEDLAKQEAEAKAAKELEERYKSAVAAGDAAFKSDNFDEAKTKYNEALGIKKDEKYPKDQLLAIDKRIADLAKQDEEARKQKELDEQYNAAIASADVAFREKKWDDAKGGYNAAIKLKASERYPKDQLSAIDKAIADEAKAAADAARKAEEEKKARELQEKYDAFMAAADGFFNGQELEKAKGKYQEALGVKSSEARPKERIAEIDRMIAEAARKAEEDRKRQELDAKYNDLVAKADKAYDGEKWADALNDYKNASELKPAEMHPKQRINDINGRLDAAAKDKAEKERLEKEAAEREQRYKDLIAAADRSFGSKDYKGAKSAYMDALEVKPGEQHPTDRITEIDKLLSDQLAADEAARLKAEQDEAERKRLEDERRRREADAAAIEAEYRDAIAKGDIAFDKEDYEAARDRYTDALRIKADEKYPKDRLDAIEKAIADRASKADADAAAEAERKRLDEERRKREAEEAERARLAAADEQARLDAERKRREEEEAERARLAALDEQGRIDAERAKDAEYQRIIADADSKMAEKEYSSARDLFTQALDVKPDEVYPKGKIEQIDQLLAEAERRRREAELAAQQKEEQPEPEVRQSSSVDAQAAEAEQFMRQAREREEREKWERIKKQRADLVATETSNRNKAGERRDGARQLSSGLDSDGPSEYAGTDALRKKNEAELAALREAWATRAREVQERNDQNRNGAWAAGDDLREQASEKDRTWAEKRTERANQNTEGKEALASAMQDDASAAALRSDKARSQAEEVTKTQERMHERGDAQRVANHDAMEAERSRFEDRQREMTNRSADARMAAKEQLDRTGTGQQRGPGDYNRGQLANQYPQGVTEESYTEGNKVIVRRVVVSGNKADNYTKVIGKSNTYYFKNGQSITEWIWAKETE